MDLRITSLGLIKNLADEVYRTLHLIGVSILLAFDQNCCADDARGSGDVDHESLIGPWRRHDQRLCKEQLKLLESCVCLFRLGKALGGLEEFEER